MHTQNILLRLISKWTFLRREGFARIVASLRANSSFLPSIQRQRIGLIQENIYSVLESIERNALYWAYREEGFRIFCRTMHKFLCPSKYRDLFQFNFLSISFRMHPCPVVLQQALKEQDFDQRLGYCYWMLGMIREYWYFYFKIIGLEATFKCYCSAENLYWFRSALRALVLQCVPCYDCARAY